MVDDAAVNQSPPDRVLLGRQRPAPATDVGHRPGPDSGQAPTAGPTAAEADPVRAVCRRLLDSPPAPPSSVTEAVTALAAALDNSQRIAADGTAATARLVELLSAALTYHSAYGDSDCPVCGTGHLDTTWRRGAVEQLSRSQEQAWTLREATRRVRRARERVVALANVVPPLPVVDPAGLDLTALRAAVVELRRVGEDPASLLSQLPDRYAELTAAYTVVAATARGILAR